MLGEKKYGIIALVLALAAVGIIWIVGLGQTGEQTLQAQAQPQNKDTIMEYSKLLAQVAYSINDRYVEKLDPKELGYAGIKGMLELLDPFSDMLEKKTFDRLMEFTHGKYQGLGMTIEKKDKYIIIVSPMEGTPAFRMGLRAGDKIIEIDGKSAYGMSSEEASNLMRGPAGTKVTLKIKREGIEEPLDYEIERAVIAIKNVPYYGVVGDGIGYVRLSRFSEDTGKELKEAIRELKNKNIKGLIFDLRFNGGGLLNEGVETSNLFLDKLDKDKLVVYTQGKKPEDLIKYFAREEALYPDKPLVVLVNEGTASASEIVAGAIQDWDRGVIIGDTTYGKGLVQTVLNMPDEVYLKLTIAKYYIPSGRCIQKPEKSKKNLALASADEGADSSKAELKQDEVFHTNGGRVVYGGGGIVPDIVIPEEKFKPIEIDLERQQLFFDFAVRYISQHKDLPRNFEVDDRMISDFKDFLKEKNFTYLNQVEISLQDLEKNIDSEKDKDSFTPALSELKKVIQKSKENDFDNSLDYIKKAIKRDLLYSLYGEKAYYEEILLKTDPGVKKAVEILSNKTEYRKLLKG
ncbi:MAG: S41 family peptidase [candidate division Zixibacteria bacterium]|nr:S41 family peptidase [candidate division Zixibacteria bacterium]